MDLETFAWLLQPAGQQLLAEATELRAAGTDAIRAGERLRRHAEPAQAAAAMSQAELRDRARDKLGADAARMYFTPEALEQATRHEVATHRARRLALAGRSVADLGCGVGGDLVALARAGLTAAGVDLDPLRVAMARANLEALGLPAALQVVDATTLDLSPFDLVFLDPARRTGHGRVFDVDAYRPSWSFVEEVLARHRSCVKVAPGVPHERVPHGVEAEWVSVRGQVKEAALWAPALATTRRRATVVAAQGLATLTDAEEPEAVEVGRPGRYVLEPDGAVVRAGLVGAAAAQVEGWLGDPHIAYVFTDQPAPSPFLTGFEVLEELPFQEKRLRAALRERGVGRLTIKKRGVSVTPEQLRARLALEGPEEATLLLTRVAGKGTALLVRRV